MRKALLSIIMAAALIIVSIISINWLYRTGDFSSDGPASMAELVDCSNEFTFEMYQELAAIAEQEGEDNIFFSPYSITTALGMVYEGAQGQTAEEMSGVLNFPADDQTRWDIMKSYQQHFNTPSDSYALSTANAYWLKENQNLLEAYRIAIESYYLAHGEELDFEGDPTGSAATINAWVEERTNGRIKDLIDPGMINPTTYLILTNAIYFKSDWRYQFNTTATEDRNFYPADGEAVQIPVMHMHDEEIKLNYSENDDVQLLQLPYTGDELSMYILLPEDLATLESALDNDYLGEMIGEMEPGEVDLYLPKFKFEQKYNLNDALIEMDMPTAFTDDADFSGITDSTSLKIGFVIHQSFVEVNEEGTEAAAATAVGMEATGISPTHPEPLLFNADHPFIFIIRHESTGQILFMGRVGNPGA